MRLLRSAVEVDVSDVVPFPGHHVVRGVVLAPAIPTPSESRPLVWCCLPGGNCTSAYFDLHVDGDDTSYSMAAHLADAGGVVVALDHLGTGASSPVDDSFLVTPELLALANHTAFTALLERLQKGTLDSGLEPVVAPIPIGVGHSMGAMITIIGQARFGTYAAVANLGGGGAGLPDYLHDPQWVTWDQAQLRASLVELARQQFNGATTDGDRGRPGIFHADDVPTPVLRAFARPIDRVAPFVRAGVHPSPILRSRTGRDRGAAVPRVRGTRPVAGPARRCPQLPFFLRHHAVRPGRFRPLSQSGWEPPTALGPHGGVGPIDAVSDHVNHLRAAPEAGS